jgi:peptide/nickel transport system permease protein
LRFGLFLLKRLLAIVVLAWLVTLGAFALFRIGVESPATTAQIDAQLGAGKPASVQYLHYLLRLLHGNFGQSLTVGLPVSHVLWQALPPTLSLIVGGMVLWLVIGTLMGIVGALRPGSLVDKGVIAGGAAALVLPTFLTALLLLDLFGYISQSGNVWIQPGYVSFTQSPGQWLGRMILPWTAIVATQAGATARLTRAAVLDTLGEEYIRVAYAKGITGTGVLLRHVLRPAIVPVIVNISTGFGILLGSAAIVDQVFAMGGIGQVLLTSVKNGDLMLIMGAMLMTVILVSLVTLAVDICQALLDPRVRVA